MIAPLLATAPARSVQLVVPDLDILRRGFDRRDPDPLVVSQIVACVEGRRLMLVGWVRQGLINRAQDIAQAERLARALSPFPDVPIQAEDHVAAAFLSQRLRRRGVVVQPAQALHWVMVDRMQAVIWSQDSRWHPLHHLGCPVVTQISEGSYSGPTRIEAVQRRTKPAFS